jgi:Lrp/AsnC family transcriptional regulator
MGHEPMRRSLPGPPRTPSHKSCPWDLLGEVFISPSGFMVRWTMQIELDRGDVRILDVLQHHGDLSAADVAERVGMTASTCWRRVSRLQELGVLKQRVALVDREKIGLNVMVFSHVKLSGHGRDALLKFEQAVREHPEILECYTLMGETDFLLRIVCRDIKAYEAFFLDHLSRFPGVQSVNSSIALAVIKETTALPLATVAQSSSR